MSRRHRAEKRPVLPDAKFKDTTVSKFMSCLMYDGKRSVAEKIVYGAFERIQEKSGNEPVKVFHDALENVRPHLEVRSRRVGGATYQVPVEVRSERAQALAIRWLIDSSRPRRPPPRRTRYGAGAIPTFARRTRTGTKRRWD